MDESDVINSTLPKFDEKIKLMVLGDAFVGKTSIIQKYCKDIFLKDYKNTVGFDFQNKIIKVKKKKINLQIWDTAGQERYRALGNSYIKLSQGFLVIYDISNRESFININNWMETIKQNRNVKFILIGNKKDLSDKREVSIKEGKDLSEKFGCSFFETSALDGENIDKIFHKFTEELLEGDYLISISNNNNDNNNKTPEIKQLSLKEQTTKKKCC
jgi:small GTP-binding protein